MNSATLLRKAIHHVRETYDATVIDCHGNDDSVELMILCGGYEPARVVAFPEDDGTVRVYFK